MGNRETRTAAGRTTLMTTEGRVGLRRFILLTPPPLIATVLPWNRDCERQKWSQNAGKWSAEAWRGENASGVGASGSRMQAGRVAENGEAARQRTHRLAVVNTIERVWITLLFQGCDRNYDVWLLLTPVLGMGHTWGSMIQAQQKYTQSEKTFGVGLKSFFQAQSKTIIEGKSIYWIMIAWLSYKQWDPGGQF
ncbi:hypothetical protein PIB30_027522 [Stylosanthes scabra]|uniref:Uncharacterized protein n=1 Tax=Stylosanthes scabra TaxID=79078 RepID=A0ABU6SAB2_9FABA|nr:hypothetical protein [Stylosanthes scabra]